MRPRRRAGSGGDDRVRSGRSTRVRIARASSGFRVSARRPGLETRRIEPHLRRGGAGSEDPAYVRRRNHEPVTRNRLYYGSTPMSALKATLKRGALVAAANWQVAL